jgi:hypothetical protein
MKIKIICKNCGSVNEKDREVLLNPDYDEDDWLCELPVNFEWILPVGKISPIVGNPLYVSSLGGSMSREDYIKKYGLDPEIAYQLMRREGTKSLAKAMDSTTVQSLIMSSQIPDMDDWTE